jgi:uncharacterized RDD family membrane protein YckC
MSVSYANFGTRLLAVIVDEIILISLSILVGYIEVNCLFAFITVSLLYSLLYSSYFIYSHTKYGKTIGKRLFSIKVVSAIDENRLISLLQSLKREGVLLLIDIILIIYFSIEGIKTNNIQDISNNYSSSVGICSLSWICIELITMLTNKKRRSLHDFLGNSVVIKTV